MMNTKGNICRCVGSSLYIYTYIYMKMLLDIDHQDPMASAYELGGSNGDVVPPIGCSPLLLRQRDKHGITKIKGKITQPHTCSIYVYQPPSPASSPSSSSSSSIRPLALFQHLHTTSLFPPLHPPSSCPSQSFLFPHPPLSPTPS